MESGTISAETARAVDAPTVTLALRRTAASHPDIVAVRTVDDSTAYTWKELLERVDSVAAGLAALEVGARDTVAVMLSNRVEFMFVDLGIATLGAIPFSIYNTYPAEQIQYLVGDAQSRVIITEQTYLPVVLAARAELPGVEHVIVIDGDAPDGVLTLAEVEEGGSPDFDGEAAAAAVGPEDLATLIYTSGTTGPPKGVQITHHNVMATARTVEQVVSFPTGSKVISWLPAAHIAERMAHHYIPTVYGGTVTVCPNPREIAGFLSQVRPNWFFAVPRIWEKIKSGLEAMLAGQPAEARAPLEQALQLSLRRVRLRQAGEPVPDDLEAAWKKADDELFSNLRAMLGLNEIRAVNVGAAPTAVEVLEFFHAIGIEVAELWGMSETCGAGTCNRPGAVRIGTVGPAIPGVEVALAEDGELLVRGERGHARLPEPAREDGRDARSPTAGSTPAISPRSTPTATSRSSTARRN